MSASSRGPIGSSRLLQQNQPEADIRPLFDHLVSNGKHTGRNGQAKRLRGLDVYNQFELSRLLNWQVRWLRPVENLVDKVTGPPEQVWDVCSIRNQTACFCILSQSGNRRESRRQRQTADARLVADCERVGSDIESFDAAIESIEGGRDILGSPDFHSAGLDAERARRRLHLAHLQHDGRIARIGQYPETAEAGDNLAQEFETLAGAIRLLDRQSSDVAARSRQALDQAVANWVVRHPEDNRDGRCLLLYRNSCDTSRDDDIHFEANEFGGELDKAFVASLGPAVLDR